MVKVDLAKVNRLVMSFDGSKITDIDLISSNFLMKLCLIYNSFKILGTVNSFIFQRKLNFGLTF